MEGASSFQPPHADDSAPSRYPSWVLLDKIAYFAHPENVPTQKTNTSTGKDVQISFFLADPPEVSYFCVESTEIPSEDYTFKPRVISSAENLVLLCFAFKSGPRSTEIDSHLVEFFVCKAGSGGNLSIEAVPYSPTGTRHSCHAAVVPRNGGNFLVADLFLREDFGHYDLLVFSSETSEWTTTYLQLRTPAYVLPRDLPSRLDKVIFLEESMVAWVDLWRGIVICDVLEKEPVLGFTPLPTTAFNLHRDGQAQEVRDVTYCNGFITFVEIEHCLTELESASRRIVKMTQNLDTQTVIPVKAFLTHGDSDDKPELVPDGWKIRTMYKGISWDYWKKRHIVHVDDISPVPTYSQLWNDGDMTWTLRNLNTTCFPFFGVYTDNVVYLMSKVDSDDEDSWIVGVDLEKKKVEVLEPSCAASASSLKPTVLPCSFSEYMNTTPRPYAELVPVASGAQNRVPNGHLSLGHTVPDDMQTQQNTLSVFGYCESWNGYGHDAHSTISSQPRG